VYQHLLVRADGTVLASYVQNECDPATAAPPAPLPTAGDILRQAPIPAPDVTTSPHADGLVGLPNWFWYEGATTVPVQATLNGWTATATATITNYHWDLGGDVGRDAVSPGSEDQPAVIYTYEHDGTYDLQMTTTWGAEFTLTGYGSTFTSGLGTMDMTGPVRPYVVRQVEAVGVRS
jgi:hypothetical protein